MTLDDMIEAIESTSPDNMWALIEHSNNPIERFQMRDVFFKAMLKLKLHYDMPKDIWHD